MSDIPAIYLDTCVFIAAFESEADVRAPARKLLRALVTKPGLATTSELTLAELLAPSQHAAMPLERRRRLYLAIFDRVRAVILASVKREVLLETVAIREQQPQRLPDAIHLATASLSSCRFFMSSDRDARRIPASLTWLTPTDQDVGSFLAAHA